MSDNWFAKVVESSKNGSHLESLFGTRTTHVDAELSAGTIVRFDDDAWDIVAPADSAKARVMGIATRFKTPITHSAEVEEFAQTFGDVVDDVDGLVDRTDLPFVTIDNVDSRDLDQALYVETHTDGYTVWYALADAAYYIAPGTPVFDAALERGASYYFPGLNAPMLPRALSEGLVSLNANVLRRSLLFEVRLEHDGAVRKTKLYRALVKSRAKLAYDQVQLWFDNQNWPGEEWVESLKALKDVGELRIELARDRNVIEFNRYEPTIGYTKDDMRFVVDTRRRNDVEKWNEQISLLCNTEGARLLEESGKKCDDLHAVFRVHLPPLRDRMRELETTIADLVDLLDLDTEWSWKRGEPLAEYLAALPKSPEFDRLRRAVERQVRWVNRASSFSERGGPHYALGVDRYARFTAPMREIVGIFTHKEALEGLGLIEPQPRDEDEVLRARVIKAANGANATQKRIEKEIGLLAIRQYLREDLETGEADRPARNGTIVGLRSSRLFVLLDDFPIDIKVYTDDLKAQFDTDFTVRPSELHASRRDAPSFALGDEVQLTTREWNPELRRFSFTVRTA